LKAALERAFEGEKNGRKKIQTFGKNEVMEKAFYTLNVVQRQVTPVLNLLGRHLESFHPRISLLEKNPLSSGDWST
jgi:hypothetical protein